MENKKLNMASLLGASNLLKQLLEQGLLTNDEVDAVMHKLVRDNGFSETDALLFINQICGKNYRLRNAGNIKEKC